MTTQKRTKLPDFSPSAKVFAKRVQKLQHIEASRKHPLAFLLQYLGYLRPTHRANQIFVPPAPALSITVACQRTGTWCCLADWFRLRKSTPKWRNNPPFCLFFLFFRRSSRPKGVFVVKPRLQANATWCFRIHTVASPTFGNVRPCTAPTFGRPIPLSVSP